MSRGLANRQRNLTGPSLNADRHWDRSEEHTSELQSHSDLVCRLLLEKKNTVQSLERLEADKTGSKQDCRNAFMDRGAYSTCLSCAPCKSSVIGATRRCSI